MSDKKYDGFYFTPGDEEDELNLTFFDFKSEVEKGDPICNTSIGDCWHVAFFRRDKDGVPYFDDTFEAIFADPQVYIKNLLGANVFGCMVRKTEKSKKWFDEYLSSAKTQIEMIKVAAMAESIANSK